MGRATIKDVAREAGVSQGTASAVINRKGSVSEALTNRVLDTVNRLGYRPNGVARSLRLQSTQTVGVLIPTILNPFYPAIVKEVDNILSANGYSMVLANTRENEDTEGELISLMREKRVDGLLISCNTAKNLSLLEELVREGLPVVAFQADLPANGLDCVAWDDFRGAFEATRHLIGTGHRRVAILGHGPIRDFHGDHNAQQREIGNFSLLSRLRGYEMALVESGIDPDPSLYLTGGTTEQHTAISSAQSAILQALEQPRPPDAVFVTGTLMALGVYKGARIARRRIPADLAVVGYDDFPWAEELSTPMTVVRRDGAKMGTFAAETLLQRLAKDEVFEPRKVVVPTELIIRESSQSFKTLRK
jgi:LacI family transcriptional regulator